jgi:hypothetical protein
MIVVRNVFRLKFGKAREATAMWKEGAAMFRANGMPSARLLTDVTGTFYTLVMETEHADLGAWETSMHPAMSDPAWKTWYERFTTLVESGYREIFTVVDEGV